VAQLQNVFPHARGRARPGPTSTGLEEEHEHLSF
jgi:hypothetical protein